MPSCRQLPPCPTEPAPAGSKMDPLLAKAEPISNSGRACGTTYLTREIKSKPEQLHPDKRGARICESNCPADPQASAEGGRRCPSPQRSGSPAARGEAPGEAGCAPQPAEGRGGADPHPQPTGTPGRGRAMPRGGCAPRAAGAGAAPGRACGPVQRSPGGSGFAGRACAPAGTRAGAAVPEGLRPGGDPAGAGWEGLLPWAGLALEKATEDRVRGRDPRLEQGPSVRSLPRGGRSGRGSV